MAKNKRYSMKVGNIGQQELDLLECLSRVDARQPLDSRAGAMLARLIEAGLVDANDGLSLTCAGIERCQSLRHRIAGDEEAAKVLSARATASAKHDRD